MGLIPRNLDSGWFANCASERARRIGRNSLLAVWILAGIVGVLRQLKGGSADFHEFYAVNRFLSGDLASVRYTVPFTYPPFFHSVVRLFVWPSLAFSAVLWFLFCSAAALVSVRMMASVTGINRLTRASLLTGVAVLLSLGLILNDLVMGNANLIVLATLVGTLYFYRQGREYMAGAVLAAGVSLKLLPLIFVFYFVYRMRFRLVAATLAALPVYLLLVPMIAFGPVQGKTLINGWVDNLYGTTAQAKSSWTKSDWSYTGTNQSLRAVLHRYLRPVKNEQVRRSFISVNIASLSHRSIELIYAGLVVCLGLGLLIVMPAHRPPGVHSDRQLYEYGLVIIAMLLVSPITWINYLIYLLVVYFVLVSQLGKMQVSDDAYHLLYYGLWTAFVLSVIGAIPQMQSIAVPFVGILVLASLLIYQTIKTDKPR